MKRMKFFFAVLICLIRIPLLAIEDDITKGKRRVAVFPFEVNSPKQEDAFLTAAFPDTLTSALSQVRALILTERGELKRLLEEQKLGQTGIIDPETAAKTGKILGAKTAVLGSFNRIGTKVRATCRLVDVDSGEVDKVHLVKVYKELVREEDLFDLMEELTNALIKTFDVKVTQEEIKQVSVRTEPTQSFSAYEFYIKGREKMLLFDIEGFEQAIPLFQKAIETDPKYALAYAAVAETYYYWGHIREQNNLESQTYYDLCYDNAQKAINLNPNLSESRRAMSVAHANGTKRNNEIKEQEAQKAIEFNPNDAEAYYILWSIYGQDPNDPKIQKALALNPRLLAAYNDLGKIFISRGLYEGAIEHFKKALEINPRHSMAHYNLGIALYNKGSPEEAIEHFKKAIEINPRYSAAHNNLGVVLKKKGLYGEAIEHYKKAFEIDPRNADAHTNLANIFKERGLYGEAIEHYRKAIEINPSSSLAHNNLGLTFHDKGEEVSALESWKKACDLGNQGACDNLKKYGR